MDASRFFYSFLLILTLALAVLMPALVAIQTFPFVYALHIAAWGIVAHPLFDVEFTDAQTALYVLALALAGIGVLASVGGSFPVAMIFVGVSFLCGSLLYSTVIGNDDA